MFLEIDHGESATQPFKAMSHDKMHYFLPFWDRKPCMHVKSSWPDHLRRIYTSNILEKMHETLVSLQKSFL